MYVFETTVQSPQAAARLSAALSALSADRGGVPAVAPVLAVQSNGGGVTVRMVVPGLDEGRAIGRSIAADPTVQEIGAAPAPLAGRPGPISSRAFPALLEAQMQSAPAAAASPQPAYPLVDFRV